MPYRKPIRTIRTHFKKSLVIAVAIFVSLYLYCTDCIPSELDTSRGGLLGAVVTILLSPSSSSAAVAVAAGAGGTVYYSLDGSNWTEKAIAPTNVTFNAVVSTGTYYVVAGGTLAPACAVYISADGMNWRDATPVGCTDTINDLVFANNTVVGVGGTTTFGGQPIVLTSNNHGSTWSMAGLGSVFPGLSEIVYDGANFLAMGLDAASVPTVFRSATPSGFVLAPFPGGRYPLNNTKNPCALGHAFHLPSVAPANRTIVAGVDCSSLTFPVASSFSDNSATSAWTYAATAIFAGNTIPEIPRGMAYNGARLVAVGDNCRVAFSDNATAPVGSGPLNWTSGTTPVCNGERWDDVVHDGKKFIAVGRVGGASPVGVMAISPTGALTDWTIQATGIPLLNAITVR
jgi:hypothetical protein